MKKVVDCTGCGKCMRACPCKLNIPALLRRKCEESGGNRLRTDKAISCAASSWNTPKLSAGMGHAGL